MKSINSLLAGQSAQIQAVPLLPFGVFKTEAFSRGTLRTGAEPPGSSPGLSGTPGRNYSIETSLDLGKTDPWQEISTDTVPSPSFQVDLIEQSQASTFYRVRSH